MEQIKALVLKPKSSLLGWLIPLGFIALLLPVILSNRSSLSKNPIQFFVSSGIIGLFLFELIIFPTMKYELKNDALYLRCGPFVSKILYSAIKNISKTNLQFHPIASCRWPGFALGKCYYADRGIVQMYSTRMCNGIILIETTTQLFGISPQNEELFIKSLRARIG